jgi:hypothetical protein
MRLDRLSAGHEVVDGLRRAVRRGFARIGSPAFKRNSVRRPGWNGILGADPSDRELAREAVWLARVLVQRMPDEPEVRGLLALLYFCESPRPARRTASGEYIPLSHQDPALWSEDAIEAAEAQLSIAVQRGRHGGRFQIEAAIQSVHADRRRTGRTDWEAIALFYSHHIRIAPTLGARVAHAVAVGEVRGPGIFGPDYHAGCPSCSSVADGFNGFSVHLANHDVMLWAVSRAPLARLKAYKQRMG